MDELETREVKVDVQVRHTILPGGATKTVLSVPCPSDGTSHLLEDCITCSRCKSLTVDPGTRTASLVCVDVPEVDDLPVPISAVMTRRVICFAAETPVAEVARVLVDQDIGGAPVVGPDGRPVGVVSRADLIRTMVASRDEADGCGSLPIHAVMTPMVCSLPSTASMYTAAALMVEENLHRLPIVDDSGKIAGIVSSRDVLRWLSQG